MKAALLLLALCSSAVSITEVSMSDVRGLKPPLVVVFHNSSADPSLSVFDELEAVEAVNEAGFRFYTVDTSQEPEAAAEAGLTEQVHAFSWTVDTGIEEIKLPFRKLLLIRYLSFLKLIPTPGNVVSIKNRDSFANAIKQSDSTPVFVMFTEKACSHCFKARRLFEQAAGFFVNFVTFASVDCSESHNTRALCASNNITEKPVVSSYTGGRSVAEFEVFFQAQKSKQRETVVVDPTFLQSTAASASPNAEATKNCFAELESLRKQVAELNRRVTALESRA